MSRSPDTIDPNEQFRIDFALIVCKMRLEKVRPEWYDRDVWLFRWRGSDEIAYTFDTNACNAMMYANGKNGGIFAQSLPQWTSDDYMAEVIWYLMTDYGVVDVALQKGTVYVAKARDSSGYEFQATDEYELGTAVCKAAIGFVRGLQVSEVGK